MEIPVLNARSEKNLRGVHPALVAVVRRAHELARDAGRDFIVTEGLRSRERQAELFRLKATTTMNSRHLSGHAVDLAALVGTQVRWDWPLYDKLAEYMQRAADGLGTAIVWGGSWRTFKDGPHFELDRKVFP